MCHGLVIYVLRRFSFSLFHDRPWRLGSFSGSATCTYVDILQVICARSPQCKFVHWDATFYAQSTHGSELAVSNSCPSIIIFSHEKALQSSSPNANIPTVKNRQYECIIEQATERERRVVWRAGRNVSSVSKLSSIFGETGNMGSYSHSHRINRIQSRFHRSVRAKYFGFHRQLQAVHLPTGAFTHAMSRFPGKISCAGVSDLVESQEAIVV